jgi:hypothetical protein
MSETQYEEPVYVVNQRREGGLAMVHMPDCRTIRHQVEQDIRDEYPRWDYEPVGTDSQGDQIYERTLLFDIQRFQAVYVTRSSLLASGLRYRTCGVCKPEIAERNHPKPYSIEAGKLSEKHLGKEFIGWGILERFAITGRLNQDGSRSVTVDAEFEGGIHYRFSPETRLEYPRPNQKR